MNLIDKLIELHDRITGFNIKVSVVISLFHELSPYINVGSITEYYHIYWSIYLDEAEVTKIKEGLNLVGADTGNLILEVGEGLALYYVLTCEGERFVFIDRYVGGLVDEHAYYCMKVNEMPGFSTYKKLRYKMRFVYYDRMKDKNDKTRLSCYISDRALKKGKIKLFPPIDTSLPT